MEKVYSRIAIIAFLAVIIFAWFVDCYTLPILSGEKVSCPMVKHVIKK